MTRSNEERYEDAIARTMARSEYPLAWLEGYPRVLFEKIKQLREGDGNDGYRIGSGFRHLRNR